MKIDVNYKISIDSGEYIVQKENFSRAKLKRILNEFNDEFLGGCELIYDSELEVKLGDDIRKVNDDNYPF